MTRESSNKQISKRDRVNRSNETKLKKKRNESSDSDDWNSSSESDDEKINIHEFRKYVQKIFPSNHLDKKIKAGEKLKKLAEKEDEEEFETDTDESDIVSSKKIKNSKKYRKNKKTEVSDDDSVSLGSQDTDEDDEDYEDEDEDDYDEDYEDDDEEKMVKLGNGKFNIIFNIGGAKVQNELDDDDDDEDYEDENFKSSDEDSKDFDEDQEVSTDESSDEEEISKCKKENSKKHKDEAEEKPKQSKKKIVKKDEEEGKPKKENSNKHKEEENSKNTKITEDKNEVVVQLKELLSKNPKDKSIKKCIEVYEENFEKEKKKKAKKNKKQKDKNMKIFRKIIRDENAMNDFSFYEKLETENQKKLIKELREINKITKIEKPYRITLLEANIPIQFKSAAMKKVNSLRHMEPGGGEFYKVKNWVDTFMKIPFTNYTELPISIENNGVDNCHEFMENAQKTLNSAVYGLNDAKMQIMQMLGQLLTNPKSIGSAIAIHGPPGTGKTSLVKEGISKILNRPFAFIALGGATDSSFLEGHGYTYEGSTWGKIVQILIDSKCMNPVIYFDELDKISDTPRGEEIAGILTHLTDTSQNSQFHDKYFAEINFDLSKCLFIFSYNDETKVNPILKDRMYRIKTKGYSGKEKTIIANNYLLPKIREQVKFNDNDIIIPDEVIGYINETHCQKEDGVRNMKRCLEIIHTKLNLYRLMKPNSNLFEEDMSLKVEFPFTVTKTIVDKLIKKESDGLETWRSLYL